MFKSTLTIRGKNFWRGFRNITVMIVVSVVIVAVAVLGLVAAADAYFPGWFERAVAALN